MSKNTLCMLLSSCELLLQEAVSLAFRFDLESESQKEENHVDVLEESVWEVATIEANANLKISQFIWMDKPINQDEYNGIFGEISLDEELKASCLCKYSFWGKR